MRRRLRRRLSYALAAILFLVAGIAAQATFARQPCANALAMAAADCCIAMPSSPDEGTAQGEPGCTAHCNAPAWAVAIVPDVAPLEAAADRPIRAAPRDYAGWSQPPESPPPRTVILA